jgi:hypothetical protein
MNRECGCGRAIYYEDALSCLLCEARSAYGKDENAQVPDNLNVRVEDSYGNTYASVYDAAKKVVREPAEILSAIQKGHRAAGRRWRYVSKTSTVPR